LPAIDTQPLQLGNQSRSRQTQPGSCAIPTANHTLGLLRRRPWIVRRLRRPLRGWIGVPDGCECRSWAYFLYPPRLCRGDRCLEAL